MDDSGPSRTAMAAAMHRAAHQTIEHGSIFSDPLALPIIGAEARARLTDWAAARQRRAMRLFIAARHHVADNKLASAIAHGTRQVVVVGAGLDTTALRNGDRGVRFFEIDHPATQAWKRRRLAEEGLEVPPSLVFAPVDFERQTLAQGLSASGFDAAVPAFFIWLGVVPYLTETAILATLGAVAAVPGAEVVFDYANPPEQFEARRRAAYAKRAARVAALGEPWLSFFDSTALEQRLQALGAVEIEDLGPTEIQRYIFGVADPGYDGQGGHILWARW